MQPKNSVITSILCLLLLLALDVGEDDDEEMPDKKSFSRDLLGGFILREDPGGVSGVNYRIIFTHMRIWLLLNSINGFVVDRFGSC